MADTGEVKYLVLADRAVPYLLARVRWPDVAQAIAASSADWLDDPGLFDLPYDPSAVTVSFSQAASVAAGWGRELHDGVAEGAPSFMRRMPANWSDLSAAERRAWGLESVGRRRASARRLRRLRATRARIAASSAAQANGHIGALAAGPVANGRGPLAGLESMATERRRDMRVRVDGRAHIRYGHSTISVGLVDLSEGGLRCVMLGAPPVLAPGATFEGPFLLEAEVSSLRICLDVVGRISWHQSIGDGTHFGLNFGELDDGETEGVQRFLAAACSRPGPR
jgi:PilZ domain-containing protein